MRIRPHSKKAQDEGWREKEYTPEDLRSWVLAGGNIGVRIRKTELVLDHDPRNDFIGDSLVRFAGLNEIHLAACPTVVTPTGGTHVFLAKDAGLDVVTSLVEYPGLDIKRHGGYVVAAGSFHPDHPTGPLYDMIRLGAPAPLPEAAAKALTRPPRPPRATRPSDISPRYLKILLAELRPEDFQDHDRWLQVMMAAHAGTAGCDEGRDVFIEWSTSDPEYADAGGVIADRWDSLDAQAANGVTSATLFHMIGADKAPPPPPEEQFDAIPDEPIDPEEGDDNPAGRMERDRHGVPKPTFQNAVYGVEALCLEPRYDEWWDRIQLFGDLRGIRKYFPMFPAVWNDNAIACVRALIVKRYSLEVSLERTHEAVVSIALRTAFNPLQDWLRALVWDETPRVDDWMTKYAGVVDSSYTRAVGRLILTAAVARAFAPGTKFDSMVIMEGKQGIGKSRLVRALGGAYAVEGLPMQDLHSKDVIDAIQKGWLIELDELDALRRADVTALKGFLSRTSDRARLAYRRTSEDFPRRSVIIGTTNEKEYLRDSTGARRFWPVEVLGLADGMVDVAGIIRDRNQIFAEAVMLWNRRPTDEALILPASVEAAAVAEQEQRYEEDSWEAAVEAALENEEKGLKGKPFLTTGEILYHALHMSYGEQTRTDRQRLAAVMARLGWRVDRSPDPARRAGWRKR